MSLDSRISGSTSIDSNELKTVSLNDVQTTQNIPEYENEKKHRENNCCGFERKIIYAVGTTWIIITIIVVVIVVVTLNGNPSKKNKAAQKFLKIQTPCATYEGLVHNVKTDGGKKMEMYEFRNIPYALPPIGKLRWRPPVAWDKCDKNEVTKYKKEIVRCAQIFYGNKTGKEDCLILTVRTPFNTNIEKSKKLPVLFWIHGGGMMYGSSFWHGYFPNEQFTASIDVVSVSINYRLNIFGFMSLKELWVNSGENKSYGNYGIMDQILALKWVRDNIENFGGDKTQVIIFGESGGGKAVFDLISSPLAKGLFVKAIPSSGYPIANGVTHHFANERFRIFLNDTKCNKGNDKDVLNCLQAITTETIIDNIPYYKYKDPGSFWWEFPYNITNKGFALDVIDGYVIPATIGNIEETPNKNIDILIGSMAQEGYTQKNASTWDGLKSYLKPKVDSFQRGIYEELLTLYNKTRDGKIMPTEITPQYVYTIATSDVLLSCQTNQIAQNLTKLENVTVYRYMVSQTQLNPYDKNTLSPTAYHGIDTEALFGNLNVEHRTQGDNELMLNLRKFFKDFLHSQLDVAQYVNKTIDFWNNTIVKTESPYHKSECEFMEKHGFLKKSWGQIGV